MLSVGKPDAAYLFQRQQPAAENVAVAAELCDSRPEQQNDANLNYVSGIWLSDERLRFRVHRPAFTGC